MTLIYALFLGVAVQVHGDILFENDATVAFSGSNYQDSTGWIYSETIDSATQWGRLRYKMDYVDETGDKYVHVTFMQVNNGVGVWSNNPDTEVTQSLRIVDSVGSTTKMQSTPDESVQYLLNIDTGTSDGELNVATEYIYSYSSDVYTCMEWFTDSDNQQIELYQDGVLVYQVNNDLTFTGPSSGATIEFTFPQSLSVSIGMYTYNGVSVSGSFKDVKIGTTRIGCDGTTTQVPAPDTSMGSGSTTMGDASGGADDYSTTGMTGTGGTQSTMTDTSGGTNGSGGMSSAAKRERQLDVVMFAIILVCVTMMMNIQ